MDKCNWEGENLERDTTTLSHVHGAGKERVRVKDLPTPLFLLPPAQLGARISPRMAEEREGIATPGWWHRPGCH